MDIQIAIANIREAKRLLSQAAEMLPANINYTTLKTDETYDFTPIQGHGLNDLSEALKKELKEVTDLARVAEIIETRLEAK